jgi:hypothetical protein
MTSLGHLAFCPAMWDSRVVATERKELLKQLKMANWASGQGSKQIPRLRSVVKLSPALHSLGWAHDHSGLPAGSVAAQG